MTNAYYNSIYNRILKAAIYNMKQFKFDIVVYDEIEYFPRDIRDSHFYYPFIDQKTMINSLAVDYNGDETTV